uniref:Uncharacterized protein n=1 Tax=Chromera velia CCMP2878 TaxID=1169474 RepID=A0A0K6SAV4_9ALVE|eukprot:Cvel_12040.t2-p1 / transcript=Cvel_12040.t2 / gene=Cvel_12040 / organism=Chromera_velia_CCMP2878 / gene_product=hypothetical protein / transcript_product=hypothetical protein / location=Cvel_scaffold773:58219-59001(-) / protein_length=166 / sequence_SO=supercontig / SO=protein_coding / is_pseudo=false
MGRGAPAARVGGECGTSSSRRAVAAPRDRDRRLEKKEKGEDEEFVLPQKKRISLIQKSAATEQGRRGEGSESGWGSASNHDGSSSGDEIDDKDYYPNENNDSRDNIDQEVLSSLRSGDKERAKRKVIQAKAVTKFIRAVKGFEGRGRMQKQMVVCLGKELDAQAEG